MIKRQAIGLALVFSCLLVIAIGVLDVSAQLADDGWTARPFFIVEPAASYVTAGFTPTQIRQAYNLPNSGGAGITIAIINAYDTPNIRNDLTVFCNQFELPLPTEANFEIHKMATNLGTDSGWALETTLDVEWTHAIAPDAKLLLVEAESPNTEDMMAAVDYAKNRSDVKAISMSWGDNEFSRETTYDSYFISEYGAVFFAASGDDGAGVMWPASSANVVAVGGTRLTLNANGSVASETGWSGSGGGVSAYVTRPIYQTKYGLTTSRRAVPDVSYNGDPATGFAVYFNSNWHRVGGTSAGAPQWAAIHALGLSATNTNFYSRAKSTSGNTYFRDITSGSNGYAASAGFDYVTGLGSPLTMNFSSHIETATNTLTLLPTDGSTLLNANNRFAVTYTIDGTQTTTYAQGGTLTVTADANTDLAVAGTATGSNTQEKWVFSFDGAAVYGKNLTLYYYDLVAQTTSYTAIGGNPMQTPTLSYVTAPLTAAPHQSPQTLTVTLTQSSRTVWVQKGTTLSVDNQLSAGLSERWNTQTVSWVAQTPNQIPQKITYYRQFLLNVTGGTGSGEQWINSGEVAQIAMPNVFDRTAGTGQRITAYSLDGGTATQVPATLQSVNISILMDTSHQLTFTVVSQFQVSLDASTEKQLAYITPPTINGDGYWYDLDTPVQVVLNGLGTRAGSTGERLAAYNLNGVQTKVATTSQVTVLNVQLTSPQTISATLNSQYQLTTNSGSINDITEPSIPQDIGWYDAETQVTITYNHAWNATTDARQNANGYNINQNPISFTRSGTGTFIVQIILNEPKTVDVLPVTQYRLTITGGHNIGLSQDSPTGDDFFDIGTAVSVTSDLVWDITNDSKRVLTSVVLNGETKTQPNKPAHLRFHLSP